MRAGADRWISGRHERWGRLVKHAGSAGKLGHHETDVGENANA